MNDLPLKKTLRNTNQSKALFHDFAVSHLLSEFRSNIRTMYWAYGLYMACVALWVGLLLDSLDLRLWAA
jgi:hypothetical protein